jgi:hypothetical protein
MKIVIIFFINVFLIQCETLSQTVSFEELKQLVSISKEKIDYFLQQKGFEFSETHISGTGDTVRIYRKKNIDETFFVGGQWIPEKGDYSNSVSFISNNKKYITDYIKIATASDFVYASKYNSENGISVYYMNPKFTMQVLFSNTNDDPSLLKLVERTKQYNH